VLAVVVATVVLSACSGAVGSLIRADDALRQSGYQSARVTPTTGFGSSTANGLSVSASLAAPPTPGDLRQVAGIIWDDVRVRFDDVAITLHGGGQTTRATYTFAQLQQAFGARNPAWNKTTLRSSVTHLGVYILLGFLGLVAVVVLVAVLAVRRSRRRRPPPPPFNAGRPGYPPGQGSPPGQAPGYSQGAAPGYPPGQGYPPGLGYPPSPGYPPGYPPGPAPSYPPGPAPGYPPASGYPPPSASPPDPGSPGHPPAPGSPPPAADPWG
jgi:hypothetical protein